MVSLGNMISAAAGAIVAGLIVAPFATAIGEHKGYQQHVAEMAIADGKAELERKGDNAKLQGMSDYDLCVVGLRGNGMPIVACEQLRGVSEERP